MARGEFRVLHPRYRRDPLGIRLVHSQHRQAGHAAGRLLVPAFRPGAAGRRAANRVLNLRHTPAPIVSGRGLGAVMDGVRPASCRRRGSLRLYARASLRSRRPPRYPPPARVAGPARPDGHGPCSEAWVSEATVVVTLFSIDSPVAGLEPSRDVRVANSSYRAARVYMWIAAIFCHRSKLAVTGSTEALRSFGSKVWVFLVTSGVVRPFIAHDSS